MPMRLKSTSREKQRDFLGHMEKLFQDPSVIVPQCVDGGMFCPFRTYEKKIASLSASGNYDKYSKSPDQILSGLSETHRAMESDQNTVFGVLKTQFGSIEYAKRGGSTDDTVLAGIQHFDDPLWRMLAFSSLAKTKGVRVYSSSNFFLGSCKNTSPGVEFFQDLLKDEGVQFTTEGSEITIGNSGHKLAMSHLSTVTINVMENSTLNTVNLILKHILTPDISADISFSCDFLGSTLSGIPANSLGMYMQGKINDRTFIRDIMDYRVNEAVKMGYYIIGEDVFKTPEELAGKYPFKYVPDSKIIEILHATNRGFQMDAFSERKVLEAVWPSHGREILKELFPDVDEAVIASSHGSPVDQIESIQNASRGMDIRNSVEVSGWSPDSQFLVDVLMDYFAHGREKSIRNAEKSLGSSNVRKSLFYAFLDCIGESRNREWQFTETEKDLAWKIRDHVCSIIKRGPDALPEEMENIRIFVR